MNILKELFVKFFVSIFVFATIFSSCASIQQDRNISIIQREQLDAFDLIMQTVSKMDCANILKNEGEKYDWTYGSEQYLLTQSEIDAILKEEGLQKSVRAKLLAAKGMVFIFDGKKSKAKDCYDSAVAIEKNEPEVVILGHRLNIISNLNEVKVAESEKGLIFLEEAIDFYKQKKYLDSLAKFDTAFLLLNSFYREAYSELRNRSWNFRKLSENKSTNSKNVAYSSKISVGQMLLVAQDNAEILLSYTKGKKLGEADLYKSVLKTDLLESASGKTPFSVQKETVANRQIVARFLWNLLCEKNNLGKTVYSESMFEESPVADVELDSADFDAILGCVEHEIIPLVDGIHFFPLGNVSTLDFISFIKKIE